MGIVSANNYNYCSDNGRCMAAPESHSLSAKFQINIRNIDIGASATLHPTLGIRHTPCLPPVVKPPDALWIAAQRLHGLMKCCDSN